MHKILLILPDPNVVYMQFVIQLIRKYSTCSNSVHVLLPEGSHDPDAFYLVNTTIHRFPYNSRSVLQRLGIGLRAITIAKTHKIDTIFGLNQTGVLISWFVSKTRKCKYYYLNDELYVGVGSESYLVKLRNLLFWVFERIGADSATALITQDRWRGRGLKKILKLKKTKVIVLPNVPIPSSNVDRSYLLKRLGLSANAKVVLHMGVIYDYNLCDELIQNVQKLASDSILVFYIHRDENKSYGCQIANKIKELAKSNNEIKKRVFIIDSCAGSKSLDDLISSATIGLAFYPAQLGHNIRLMGYASGRVNSYLVNGVPCLATDLVGLRWIRRWHAGEISTNKVDDVVYKINLMLKNISYYREGCKNVAESQLNFDYHFSKMLNVITGS